MTHQLNIEQSANRLAEALNYLFLAQCKSTTEYLAHFCESEIELILGGAIITTFDTSYLIRGYDAISICRQASEEFRIAKFEHVLIPQYKWNEYRIDFVVRSSDKFKNKYVFIECDGHEFHERTKEQAANDRSRDRAITTAEIPILRFTGSEIYRNPDKCVTEIVDVICVMKPLPPIVVGTPDLALLTDVSAASNGNAQGVGTCPS